MSSSCSNPFLYGWLNQNFRNEFEQIFGGLRKLFLRVCLNKKVPVVLQRRHSSGRTNGQQEQRFGDDDAPTMSPTQELMPYPLDSKNKNRNNNNNNTECTAMTDLRSCGAYCNDQQHQHSVLINFEKPCKGKEKNGHVKARKKNKNQGGMGKLLTADPITNETRTTQLYLDTNFGVEGECTSTAYYQCSIEVPAVQKEQQQQQHHYRQNEQNAGHQQRNSHIAGSRFKRLSLTDSRKRKRKKCNANGAGKRGGAIGDECPSVSAIATDHSSNSSIGLSMDKNNNGNDHNSNGIVLSGGGHKAHLVVSVEQKGHPADYKRNDLTEALLM